MATACIAHDRRGHGRSSQPWDGNDMDHYADDLAEVIAALDLKNAVAGRLFHRRRRGGALHRPPRHQARRQGLVLVSAVPPLMLKTAANPGGLPIEVFDGIRAGVDRQPLAVVQGHRIGSVLRLQPSGRQGLARA
jgi:non-heme chloroperoxidase